MNKKERKKRKIKDAFQKQTSLALASVDSKDGSG